ncbi:MAG: hypothetical protein WC136_00570 [Sphaerochaeta sp.]|jgi:hypothetical protein
MENIENYDIEVAQLSDMLDIDYETFLSLEEDSWSLNSDGADYEY